MKSTSKNTVKTSGLFQQVKYGQPSGKPEWFHNVSARIANGGMLGTLWVIKGKKYTKLAEA